MKLVSVYDTEISKRKLLDEEIIKKAKDNCINNGTHYSLEKFEKEFNEGAFDDSHTFIKFFEKEDIDEDLFLMKIKNETSEWINSNFNCFHKDILDALSDKIEINTLEPDNIWIEEFINQYPKYKNLSKDDILELIQYEDWKIENSKYQELEILWNFVFEFKGPIIQEMIDLCSKSGFIVLETTDYFNHILAFNGAGYDFYTEHWIPLYLSLPQNKYKKERYLKIINNNNEL